MIGSFFAWIDNWASGDTPAAGSQSADSHSVNGQWYKIAEKMNVLFSLPANTLRSSIIDAAQLKSSVADDTTITKDASTGKLKVKDGGIDGSKTSVDIADGTTIVKDATTGKLKVADALSSALDGAKFYITFDTFNPYNPSARPMYIDNGFMCHGGVLCTINEGVPVVDDCVVVGASVCTYGGNVSNFDFSAAPIAFAAGAKLSPRINANFSSGVTGISIFSNGTAIFGFSAGIGSGGTPLFLTLAFKNV